MTVAAVVGLAAGAAVAVASVWQLAVVSGWIAATAAFLGWIWFDIGRLDAKATAAVATREDAARDTSRILLLSASMVSLIAVLAALHRARSGGVLALLLTSSAMLAIIAAWLVVHTVYTLHYAHLYYRRPPGGIEFPGPGAEPSYRDFAYMSFTIGMTFQVSDTPVHDPAIRHMVLRHALLSYVFGTAIIAGAINMLAGFLG